MQAAQHRPEQLKEAAQTANSLQVPQCPPEPLCRRLAQASRPHIRIQAAVLALQCCVQCAGMASHARASRQVPQQDVAHDAAGQAMGGQQQHEGLDARRSERQPAAHCTTAHAQQPWHIVWCLRSPWRPGGRAVPHLSTMW